MVKQLTCDECRDLAPELVLGLLDGAERVDALAHLTSCADCRGYVEDLTGTADALLLVGPEAEPPAGFDAMVQERLHREQSTRLPSRRPLAAVAAAVALIALSAGLYIGRASAPEPALRQAAVVSANGARMGEVYLHDGGDSSWCYVELDAPSRDGEYEVRATLRDGRVITVETVYVKNGRGSYGRALSVPAGDVVRMTIESIDGRWRWSADLST